MRRREKSTQQPDHRNYCGKSMLRLNWKWCRSKALMNQIRKTEAHIHEKGNLKIVERFLTQGNQQLNPNIEIIIEGNG